MREFNQDVDQVIGHLIEASGEFKDIYRTEKTTYRVRRTEYTEEQVTYEIEVPPLEGTPLVNRISMEWSEYPGQNQQEEAVWKRMVTLAKTRSYPPGSVFLAPWGTYLVQDLIQL